MKKLFFTLSACCILISAKAQLTPDVTSWIINLTGATGYASIPSNVQQVQYSAANVYVSCTCIPGYSIGPWTGNPNTPSNQNFVFKITRTPVPNTGTLVNVGLGHIGIWSNGVSIFNPKDGFYWDNATSSISNTPGPPAAWNRNALVYEGVSFDNCLGHPQQQGEYHHHVNPTCLYDDADSTHHSPIIGYAFDGYPIYGAYAYANTNGTGAITRMKSSYVLSTATTRASGPPVNATYPLGNFCEDFVYTSGAGDLDVHNGRFCITPEYPAGTYAYFVTIDANRNPVYPFVLGSTYYGTVQSGNTGPGSGVNTVSETVTTYIPATVNGISELTQNLDFLVFPNPTNSLLFIHIRPIFSNDFTVELYDMSGKKLLAKNNLHPTITESLDVSQVPSGNYIIKVFNDKFKTEQKVVIEK